MRQPEAGALRGGRRGCWVSERVDREAVRQNLTPKLEICRILVVQILTDHCTGWCICPKTWVGLTLMWVFHHLAQLHSHFCQIQPRQNWADSGTPKIQVNPTQVLGQMNNPVHGGPSGRGTLFVDIKLKVPPQYKLILLNSYFNVNKSLSSTRWTTL